MLQINIEERVGRFGENSQFACAAKTHDAHVVLPDGTIKRCQLATTRTLPFFRYGWRYRGNKIIGIDWVDLTVEWKEAGATFLKHDYEADGRAEAYAEYCAWEEAADLYKNRSADDKMRMIPDITPHLPKSVMARRDASNQAAQNFPAAVLEAARAAEAGPQEPAPEDPEPNPRGRKKVA